MNGQDRPDKSDTCLSPWSHYPVGQSGCSRADAEKGEKRLTTKNAKNTKEEKKPILTAEERGETHYLTWMGRMDRVRAFSR
jgi:hypothetical protein